MQKRLPISRIPKNIKIFGNKNFRGICPSEHVEQRNFFQILKIKYPKLHKIAMHIKNEGNRTYGQFLYDAKQGLNVGCCDIIIPCVPSICIEMKRIDQLKSKTTQLQIEYIQNVIEQGGFGCFCLGADAGLEAIEYYYKHVI